MKIIGYVRVSTSKQELSPEAQREAITTWCAARGATLVATFEDLGVSGGCGLDARPGLAAAIDAVPRGGALVAAKRDRIARDVFVSALVERLVERKGGRVMTADNAGEGAGPEAQLMRRILDSFSEFERALIRQRTTAALATKRARGERMGTVAYGCAVGPDGKTLVPHEAEQATLARIRTLRARGLTLRAIAADLDEAGIRTRRGGRWTFHDVRRVLDPARARDEARAYRARRRQGGRAA